MTQLASEIFYKSKYNKNFYYKLWHQTWRQTRPNLKKLGKSNDLQEENAISIVTYITEQNESNLLQEFDMPLYYEKFIFSNGVLKEYEFGFEYP
ncbi:hypothetical protein A3835_06770 [Campylobacter concisus]|uniref:Uncharacterized protein n=1 Tax=Campylobacter concisus TaxID=199 RepID=A0A1X0U1Q8_9BACT|nr:hypothetical protein A3835_06770 [Campylobacter concisus]